MHTSIQGSGSIPAFPAQWLYGLLRALPGERLFCHRRHAKTNLRNLTPAPRRQDHTTSPYASRAYVIARFASTASHRTFVTIAKRPSIGWDARSYAADLLDGGSGIFLACNLDAPNRFEMAGEIRLFAQSV